MTDNYQKHEVECEKIRKQNAIVKCLIVLRPNDNTVVTLDGKAAAFLRR